MEKAIIEGAIHTCSECSVKLKNNRIGHFREFIERGAISRSLKGRKDVYLTYNHLNKIADTTDVEVWETVQGIGFKANISDPEVVAMIQHRRITGCSFSFWARRDYIYFDKEMFRAIKDLDIYEISLLDVSPAYPSEVKLLHIPEGMILEVNKARLRLLSEDVKTLPPGV